jgi:hypothetical protein
MKHELAFLVVALRGNLHGLNESAILTILPAQDAAKALIALGCPVRPVGTDWELWKIGDFVMTDKELIGLAARRGIRPAVGQVQ